MRSYALGIITGIIICMVILCYIPLTETELSLRNVVRLRSGFTKQENK